MIMKGFIVGFLTALVIIMLVAIEWYDGYGVGRAYMYETLVGMDPTQKRIEANIRRLGGTSESGNGVTVSEPDLARLRVAVFVTTDGAIVVQSKRHGELLVLLPIVDHDKITWRCMVGPYKSAPGPCR